MTRVRKLRIFAYSDAAGSDGKPIYKTNDSALLLGMYLRRYGNIEESKWKACFRDSIVLQRDEHARGRGSNE